MLLRRKKKKKKKKKQESKKPERKLKKKKEEKRDVVGRGLVRRNIGDSLSKKEYRYLPFEPTTLTLHLAKGKK